MLLPEKDPAQASGKVGPAALVAVRQGKMAAFHSVSVFPVSILAIRLSALFVSRLGTLVRLPGSAQQQFVSPIRHKPSTRRLCLGILNPITGLASGMMRPLGSVRMF